MIKKIGILCLIFVLCNVALKAIQSDNQLYNIQQPDGTSIRLQLVGDSFYSYYLSEDGSLVDVALDGYFYYARMLENGKIKRSNIRASIQLSTTEKKRFQTRETVLNLASSIHRSKLVKNEKRYNKGLQRRGLLKRIPGSCASTFPTKGQPKSLVILVEYKDIKFSIKSTNQSFKRLLNEEGYSDNNAIGSARDYFKACSHGTFVPTFDVYGPYTLPHNRIYYGKRISEDETDEHPHEMIRDALIAADNDINYKDYDVNGDGKIDNVFVYYAGYNEAERGPSESVWPHRHALYDMTVQLDGVQAYDYACTSELNGNEGSVMCGMATFSHEFGHVLGLVDYYATDYSHNNVPGRWNIMSRGNYNGDGRTPPLYCAQDRFYLGWINPQQIVGPAVIDLPPLATSNKSYLLAVRQSNLNGKAPNPLEYFLLENRQYVGWDSSPTSIPGHGLLISHVDYNAANWKVNKPNNNKDDLGYEIVRADKSVRNESGDPFPGTQSVNLYNPILKNGVELGLPITQIEENIDTIHFLVKGGDGRGLHANMYSMWFDGFYSDNLNDTVRLQLEVTGKKLSEPLDVYLLRGQAFRISTDDHVMEGSKVTLPLEKDSVNATIYVEFIPSLPYQEKQFSDVLILKSGVYQSQVELNGTLHKDKMIVAPRLKDETAVSGQSLTLNWESIAGIESYRINVMHASGDATKYVQNFERFGSPLFTEKTNWHASFTNYTVDNIPSYPRAARFCEKGQWIQSEVYPSAIAELKFWLQAQNVNGSLLLEAYDGKEWHTLDTHIDWTLKEGKVYELSIDPELHYIAFKFTYKGDGTCILDDVVALCSREGVKVVDSKICSQSYLIVGGLDLDMDYTYYIEAHYVANKIEYFSLPSVIGKVRTAENSIFGKDAIPIIYDETLHRYIAFLPKLEKEKELFIYDISAHQVARFQPESTHVVLPELPKNSVYILIYCDPTKRVISTDLRTKFVYN